MPAANRRFSPQELGALGIGLAVTIASALLTSAIPFPFNFLISFGLGGMAFYGALKILDPRTRPEVEEQLAELEFRATLHEVEAIARKTADAARKTCDTRETSQHLDAIARKIEMIIQRYRERPRDFTGAASILLVLEKFDEILAHYLKVKCGALFLDKRRANKVIEDTEGHVIPMVEQALENLGRKMDFGEASDKEIHGGTLEDMLGGLDLIRFQRSDLLFAATKEAPDDKQK